MAYLAHETIGIGSMEALQVILRSYHTKFAYVTILGLSFFGYVMQNPVGRIVNRFSKDQALVDEVLPSTAQVRYKSLILKWKCG